MAGTALPEMSEVRDAIPAPLPCRNGPSVRVRICTLPGSRMRRCKKAANINAGNFLKIWF